jgi:hypothetical protein
VTILSSVVMAGAFPSGVKHDADLVTEKAGVHAAAQETASVPEFVSLVNLSQFLLASEENLSVSTEARQAAEALSARFAGSPTGSEAGSESEFLHVVVQQDPVPMNLLDAPKDPEKPPRDVVASDDDTADARDLNESKDSAGTAKPEAASEAPTMAASDSMMRLGVPVPRSTKGVRSNLERQSGVRQRGHRSASADKTSKSRLTGSGKGADTERLVGFVGLSADQMLAN